MNAQTLQSAVELAEQRQHMLISTIDRQGMPHIASVGSVRRVSNQRIALGDWYCPATLLNIEDNSQLAMVVWDIGTDIGYQLFGEVEAISPTDDAMGDLFEQELLVRVDKVLDFSHASHTDTELTERGGLLTAEQPDIANADGLSVDSNWEDAYLYLKQST